MGGGQGYDGYGEGAKESLGIKLGRRYGGEEKGNWKVGCGVKIRRGK